MVFEKCALLLTAFKADRNLQKMKECREMGLKLIAQGEKLTSPRLIALTNRTTSYGYTAKFYSDKYMILQYICRKQKRVDECCMEVL